MGRIKEILQQAMETGKLDKSLVPELMSQISLSRDNPEELEAAEALLSALFNRQIRVE